VSGLNIVLTKYSPLINEKSAKDRKGSASKAQSKARDTDIEGSEEQSESSGGEETESEQGDANGTKEVCLFFSSCHMFR